MNILQDLKQNEFHQQPKMSKSSSIASNNKKVSSKSSNSYEIEMQIGIAYNELLSAIKENGFSKEIRLPEDGVKAVEKLELIKKTVMILIEEAKKGKGNGNNMRSSSEMDESNVITCVDCQNYENNLQKLQNEVRQHIRLEQQLKIYQEGMEEKIEELKKEKTHIEKKYEEMKKKVEEQKHNSTNNSQKLQKLEYQNQKLKSEIKQMKQMTLDASKKIKGYDTRERDRLSEREKENRIDWVHRMSSVHKKQEKESTKEKMHTGTHTERGVLNEKNMNEKTDRKSIEKRADSSERWRMSGARSTKLMNFNEKIIQEKNKEERKKAIQSKFEYRR